MEYLVPELVVSDISKSLELYRDILGFDIFMSVPEGESRDYAWVWLKKDGIGLMLERKSDAISSLPHLAEEKSAGNDSLYGYSQC